MHLNICRVAGQLACTILEQARGLKGQIFKLTRQRILGQCKAEVSGP
jgi:hypothetical protein